MTPIFCANAWHEASAVEPGHSKSGCVGMATTRLRLFVLYWLTLFHLHLSHFQVEVQPENIDFAAMLIAVTMPCLAASAIMCRVATTDLTRSYVYAPSRK